MWSRLILVVLISGCAGTHQADEITQDLSFHIIPHPQGGCEMIIVGTDRKDRGTRNVEVSEKIIPVPH